MEIAFCSAQLPNWTHTLTCHLIYAFYLSNVLSDFVLGYENAWRESQLVSSCHQHLWQNDLALMICWHPSVTGGQNSAALVPDFQSSPDWRVAAWTSMFKTPRPRVYLVKCAPRSCDDVCLRWGLSRETAPPSLGIWEWTKKPTAGRPRRVPECQDCGQTFPPPAPVCMLLTYAIFFLQIS